MSFIWNLSTDHILEFFEFISYNCNLVVYNLNHLFKVTLNFSWLRCNKHINLIDHKFSIFRYPRNEFRQKIEVKNKLKMFTAKIIYSNIFNQFWNVFCFSLSWIVPFFSRDISLPFRIFQLLVLSLSSFSSYKLVNSPKSKNWCKDHD